MTGLRRAVALAALAVVVGTALAAAALAAAWVRTPSVAGLEGRLARPLPVSSVAPIFLRALVATEDERFYRHHGIDVIGLLRAVPYDVTHLSLAQGASTLTEQVAKLLYLGGNDHTPWRKLEDMALALKLERSYSKQQILAAYLDSAYFGEGAVGVAAAARTYFGVPPSRLTLAQASLLAGLPQAPGSYDPFVHPDAARARQVEVLRSLVRVGAVSVGRAQTVVDRPLRLRRGASLAAVPGADVAPGPALSTLDAVVGGLLLLTGAAAVLSRRLVFSARGAQVLTAAVSVAMLVLGAALVLRSLQTV